MTGDAAVTKTPPRPVRAWPLFLIAAPAAVAIWSGWVPLGEMCGFGPVHLLPGIAPGFVINSAITLPIGVEAYGAYALRIWLTPGLTAAVRKFAKWSAIGALCFGGLGQVLYHLLAAYGFTRAPVPVIVVVSCMPVAALALAAALVHMIRNDTAVRPVDWAQFGRQVQGAWSAVTAKPSPTTETVAAVPESVPVIIPEPAPARSRSPKGLDPTVLAQVRDQLAATPDLTGATLAPVIGKGDRQARRYLTAARNGHGPVED